MKLQDCITAIANFDGWFSRKTPTSGSKKPRLLWFGPDGEANRDSPPNYLTDLNAVRKVEGKFTDEMWESYKGFLGITAGQSLRAHIHASATQRCEAILMTLRHKIKPGSLSGA